MSDVFQPEQVLSGRYRVLRKIGGGGMADVYLCEDLTLGRRVALKVLLQRLLDDPNFVERFRREAKAAAGLNHANLVSIFDWGEVDGTYFIVMEYVEGETLKDLVRRQGRLGGSEAVRISLQLLAALEFAHRTGIVHRDIKPQNVMLDRDGNVKVTDFGIARAVDSGMTEAGSILGTAQYLAPEQAKGQRVDERSDLYSVGIVLYEMLTGTVPFKGDTAVTVALKHVNEMASEPAQLVPGMPYALNQIVLKAIAKDPDERYQTAAQFARDLRSAQVGGPVMAAAFDSGAEATRLMTAGAVAGAGATSVMTGGPLDQSSGDRGRRRRRWPWVLLIILLLLVIAAAAYGLVRAMGSGSTVVPTVVGKSKAAALTKLEEAGFKAGVQEEYSDKYAQGIVSRQAPAGGTKLRKGETVDVWVSKGSETVTLEDFKGWTPAEVRDWLNQNGLSGLEKSGQVRRRPVGQGVQAGPARRRPGEARRHHHLLGEQRQAAGDRPRSHQPDAGRGADGPGRRRSAARHGHARAEHHGAQRPGRPPGPRRRRRGGEGVRREHRRVERFAVAVAEPDDVDGDRPQRPQYGRHDGHQRAQRCGARRRRAEEGRHRPASGHGGRDEAGRRHRGGQRIHGASDHRQVDAFARRSGRAGPGGLSRPPTWRSRRRRSDRRSTPTLRRPATTR